MVSPLHKRRAVQAVVALGLCSQPRACRYLDLDRSSGRYQNKGPSDWLLGLRKQIEALSRKYPRLGYRKLTRLLMAEGWKAGKKLVQRIRRECGLRDRDFVAALDTFLDQLPKGWDYSVEDRNESLLHPQYFEVLKLNHVAHTLNSWSRMPSVSEQMRMVGCETADFVTARFLLKPGRSYEQAVKAFQPYREIREPVREARSALQQLLGRACFSRTRKRYVYVNNRLEGSAPLTIAAVIEAINESKPRHSA
jgi:hypothetical protein